MNDIPDWAGKRACELLNADSATFSWCWPEHVTHGPVRAIAKLVMQHEQPPADPELAAVKRLIEALERAVSQYKQEKANG